MLNELEKEEMKKAFAAKWMELNGRNTTILDEDTDDFAAWVAEYVANLPTVAFGKRTCYSSALKKLNDLSGGVHFLSLNYLGELSLEEIGSGKILVDWTSPANMDQALIDLTQSPKEKVLQSVNKLVELKDKITDTEEWKEIVQFIEKS